MQIYRDYQSNCLLNSFSNESCLHSLPVHWKVNFHRIQPKFVIIYFRKHVALHFFLFFVIFTLSWNLSGSVTPPPRNKEAIELREPFSVQTFKFKPSRILSLATHDSRLLPNIVVLEPDPKSRKYN